ncbi:MAG: hypothetical protein KDC87_05725 [Planctomycetes bacterium]|nr:hypothetical protein [Planctomycetota bacterium]
MGKTLLGVVHLGALPSAAGCCEFEDVATAALRDAEALVAGGVDGVMVENFGDAPFHKGTRDDPVPPDVIAGLAVVAARDLAERSGASGLVLSGRRTGEPVDEGLVDEVRAAVGAFPIWLGSGLTAQNADRLWSRCDGAIVATALQTGGLIDVGRVRELRAALRG